MRPIKIMYKNLRCWNLCFCS